MEVGDDIRNVSVAYGMDGSESDDVDVGSGKGSGRYGAKDEETGMVTERKVQSDF